MSFNTWQRPQTFASLSAELSTLLHLLPARSTDQLMMHSTTLARHLPTAMKALKTEVLAWVLAVITAKETTA